MKKKNRKKENLRHTYLFWIWNFVMNFEKILKNFRDQNLTLWAPFWGAILTIFLLASIIITSIYIAIRVKNQFSRLLVIGVTTIFFLHIFINIGMVMGILPVVGAPLPFVSYGGTMMATMLIGFGLVLNAHLYHDQTIKSDEWAINKANNSKTTNRFQPW